jgi:four helix bundle protein
MNEMKHAENFSGLLVYQKARELQAEIFIISQAFPKEEKFSLTDQVRRSSRAIGANIAEAWGKRRYEAHFVSKLSDADSEQYETRHWIDTAVECGYLEKQRGMATIDKCKQIGRLLGGMMEKAGLFCGNPPRGVHEACVEYLFSPDE